MVNFIVILQSCNCNHHSHFEQEFADKYDICEHHHLMKFNQGNYNDYVDADKSLWYWMLQQPPM